MDFSGLGCGVVLYRCCAIYPGISDGYRWTKDTAAGTDARHDSRSGYSVHLSHSSGH